jgi:hypothetical protein
MLQIEDVREGRQMPEIKGRHKLRLRLYERPLASTALLACALFCLMPFALCLYITRCYAEKRPILFKVVMGER